MPTIQFNDQPLYAGRTEDYEWAAYRANGSPEAFAEDDEVRCKLALTEGGDPVLEVTSAAATANGSIVTIDELGEADVTPASGTVRLGQADTLLLTESRYFCELVLIDNSEVVPENAAKVFLRGWLQRKGSPGGPITLPS